MHEILKHLPPGARVLDLDSREGSFAGPAVRVDLEFARVPNFVQADAAALPFPHGTFDAVIANHSLEHFADLDRALQEIGRVTKRTGALFIAVPDASTFTDRLYRWLARGGGHVNAFRSPEALAGKIARAAGLEHAGTRVLYTSLSFLNPHNRRAPAPRKAWLLAGGREPVLLVLNYALRLADRSLGTRWSIYGWAMYFGHIAGPVDPAPLVNVCVRCGSGHPAPAAFLWRCAACGARNLRF